MGVRTRWASTTGAVVFGAVTTAVGVTQGAPVRFLLLDGLLGLAFVVAGALAWRRRPEVPTGPLLTAAALLWFVGSYGPTGIGWLSALGVAFERYYDLVLVVLVLTFPARALRGRARAVVLAMALAMLVRSLARLLVYDPAVLNPGCPGCPSNPFAVHVDATLLETVETATGLVVVATSLVAVVLVVARWRAAAAPARRVLAPVSAAGAAAGLAAAYTTADVFLPFVIGRRLLLLEPPWQEVHSWTLYAIRALIPLGFLLGVLRLRAPQGAAGRLALAVEPRDAGPERLGDAVRRALGDPTAQLVRVEAESGRWLDEQGRSVTAPVPNPTRGVLLLERDGAPGAALLHDPVLVEDQGLLSSVSAVLRLALDNERLAGELREQLAEVRASRARLVTAADDARRRIERDLHDGAQQRLLWVSMALTQVRRRAAEGGADGTVLTELDDVASELRGAMSDMRELARGIHPALLTSEGCAAAVRALARRSVVPVDLRIRAGGRHPEHVEIAAYYVVAEGLANVMRHARATAAGVCLAREGDRLVVEVTDDGTGGADPTGAGLRGLSDRVAALGGTLLVQDLPHGGTRLRAELPCG
jgi:signal transduction histidine kinase